MSSQPLAPGAPVERALASGERHVYRIEISAGRPLLAIAEQRGIDLEILVEAPDGRELAWMDSPNGPRGPEVLAVRPEASGDHRLVVLARDRGTIAGSYRLEVRELPEGSPHERTRAAAELVATRAAQRSRPGGREAWSAALEEVRKALGHWLASGEEPGRALLRLAILHLRLNESAAALETLERARTRFEAEGDAAGVAAVWNEIGYLHGSAGRAEPARQAYDRTLAAWRALGDRHGEAMALNNLGLVEHGQGELHRALDRYEPAAELFRALGDFEQAALARNNLAGVWDLLGEPRRAQEGYRQSLELLRQTGERREEPRLLSNLATAHRALGELQEALTAYRQALDLFRLGGDRRGEGTALNNLGMTYLGLGEPRRARSLLEQALALRREAGDRRGEAVTLHNLGIVSDRLGEPRQALDLLRQALALREPLGDRLGRAYTLERMGAVHASLGEPAEALRRFEEALAILGDSVGRGRALTSAAEAHRALGDPGRAAESLRAGLELLRAAGDRSGEARALAALARAERALGRPVEALAYLQQAFERIEELRSRVGSPELRASYLAAQRGAYELAIDVRLDLHRLDPAAGHDRAAFEVSERARARSLLDLLGAAGTDLPPGIDPELVRRRQTLRERAGAKEMRRLALLAADASPAKHQEVERELDAVLLELQLLEGEITRRAASPAPWSSLAVGPPEIQALLDADTLLLEYVLGEERSFLWAVSASSFEVFELPGRPRIEDLATRVYRRWSTLDTKADDGGAAELSRLLLGPVAGRLGTRRLAIVPDGALHYLPFSALPHPAADGPLLARHEVVTLPSASFLAAQRRALSARPRAAGALALLADPVFDPRDPRVRGAAARSGSAPAAGTRGAAEDLPLFDRLTSSRREAETIASLARGGEVLLALDFQARRSLLTDGRLAGFRVLHFATHGTFHGEHPELSGIVLSLVDESGRPREGFLRLPDLHGLSLAADLVVLSGCQTALGREIRGEGLVGLSRGFLDAGARNLVASLWQVPDRATAELMTSFYRDLLERGAAPASALRQAQLAVRARRGWSDPYYWASFILLGEGR
jgi:CHAT domain-containing protein/tetratricopeptide (TPR) repeat protein